MIPIFNIFLLRFASRISFYMGMRESRNILAPSLSDQFSFTLDVPFCIS